MEPPHIGLFSYGNAIEFAALIELARALQQQMFHLQSIWGPQATAVISAFPNMDQVHPGVWPIVFSRNIADGNGGYHVTSAPQPTAYVQAGDWYTFVASHECIEMVLDPWGNSRCSGWRPATSGLTEPRIPVEYLLEACDPCLSPHAAYPIGDIWVSDFVTPEYYNPEPASTRFSYAGRINGPGELTPSGYVTWFESSLGKWYQKKTEVDGQTNFFDLGTPDMSRLPARMAVDRAMQYKDLGQFHVDDVFHASVRERHQTARLRAGAALLAQSEAHLTRKASRSKLRRIRIAPEAFETAR